MTDERQRQPLIRSAWLRAPIIIAIFVVAANRASLLAAIGYSDTGWPRWTFAGLLTVVIVIFLLFMTREPLGVVFADGPRAARLGYMTLLLLVSSAACWVLVAGIPWTSPIFLVPVAAVIALSILEWAVMRNQTNRT